MRNTGGLGGDVMMQTLAIEEMSQTCPALAMNSGRIPTYCGTNNIHKNANEYLKERCSLGEKIGALGLTEPSARHVR